MQEYSDLLGTMVYKNIILPYHMQNRIEPKHRIIREKPKRKCLRDGCETLTNHNGGYCSAECCREDNVKKSN